MQHTIKQELKGVMAFIGTIWAVFILELIIPFNLTSFGLVPRTFTGLVGIPAMPFLHANLQHIVSNTVPLFILLTLLAGSKATRSVVAAIIALGGALLWLFGRPAIHIGASGLIFGLMGFLIVSGLLERRFVPLVISVVVILFSTEEACCWASCLGWDHTFLGTGTFSVPSPVAPSPIS